MPGRASYESLSASPWASAEEVDTPQWGSEGRRSSCGVLKPVALAALAAAAPRRLGRPPLSSPRSAPPADELSARASFGSGCCVTAATAAFCAAASDRVGTHIARARSTRRYLKSSRYGARI